MPVCSYRVISRHASVGPSGLFTTAKTEVTVQTVPTQTVLEAPAALLARWSRTTGGAARGPLPRVADATGAAAVAPAGLCVALCGRRGARKVFLLPPIGSGAACG